MCRQVHTQEPYQTIVQGAHDNRHERVQYLYQNNHSQSRGHTKWHLNDPHPSLFSSPMNRNVLTMRRPCQSTRTWSCLHPCNSTSTDQCCACKPQHARVPTASPTGSHSCCCSDSRAVELCKAPQRLSVIAVGIHNAMTPACATNAQLRFQSTGIHTLQWALRRCCCWQRGNHEPRCSSDGPFCM